MEKRNIAIALPSTGEEEWQACREPLMSGWLTQGPKVAEFEKAFAEKHHAQYALATTSCTTALHLALAALGIGQGDDVLVPSFTWVATANAVLYCGANPILVDVRRDTYNIDVEDVIRKLTPKTKAVIPVHLFGQCVDFDALKAVLPPQVKIIEDGACASGARYKERCAGTLGDFGAFSFHPRKSISTGEGGMLTTNNKQLAEIAGILRNHGASVSEEQRHKGPKPYILPEFNLLGFNYRMTDLQASIGYVQLAKLERFISERQKWANFYRQELAGIEWLQMPHIIDGIHHAWQAFVTYVEPKRAPRARDQIMEYLQEKGIATRPGTHAVHMLGYYQNRFGFKDNDLPGARDCYQNTMAIPLHNRMTAEDYHYVVEVIKNLGKK